MNGLLLHPQTKADIDAYLTGMSHALLIQGQAGAGKYFLSIHIAAQLLEITEEQVVSHPFFLHVQTSGSSIGIEEVRQLHIFLRLKTTGKKQIRRVAIIENAHLLTPEAQNSLLKALEEPPSDTVLILTAITSKSILPTIHSRVQQITVKTPSLEQLKIHYKDIGVDNIENAFKLSSGLMGLTDAILSSDQDHAIFGDVQKAKQLLQLPVYERLVRVDELIKDRSALEGLLFVLRQIASSTLLQAGKSSNLDIKRWHNLYREVYLAEKRLEAMVSPKLVMTDLLLNM